MSHESNNGGRRPVELPDRHWLTSTVGGVIFLTLATALVVPGVLAAGYLLVALLAVIWLTRHSAWRDGSFDSTERLLIGSILVFIVVWLVGCLAFGIDEESRRSATRILRLLPAVPVFLLLRKSRSLEPALWHGLTAGAIVAGVYAIGWVATGQVGEFDGRVEGPTNPIYFGGLTLAFGLMLVPRVIDEEQTTGLRMLALAGIIMAFVACALSGSRGAWLAVPVIVGVYLFTLGARQAPVWRYGTAAVLLALSLLALALPFLPVHERIAESWLELDLISRGLESNGPLGIRWQMWQIAISVIADNPLLGAGPGAFREALEQSVAAGLVDPVLLDYDHPHNQYLSALCHFGLPALAAFLMLIVSIGAFFADALRALSRESRFLAWSGFSAICVLAVMALSESIFERNAGVVWFGLLSAVIAGLLAARRNGSAY